MLNVFAAVVLCLPLGAAGSDTLYCRVTVVASPDSDGDGLTDANELWLGTATNKIDTDGDGLEDGEEYLTYGTDPVKADTDGDRMPDGWEVRYGLSPTNTADINGADGNVDGDLAVNLDEYIADTNPTNANSQLLITGISTNGGGIRINWQGGTQVWQYLECRQNLLTTAELWTIVKTNVPDTPVTNWYTDLGATNTTYFYRIRAKRP